MTVMRKATAADVDAINALVRAAYTPWIAMIGTTPGPMLDDYAQLIAHEWVGVAEDAAGLTELLVLIRQDKALLIDNIAIRPDQQEQGLGSRILQRAEVIARTGGFLRLRLYAHEKMTANIALYERQGYSITHRVTERRLPRVYMEKQLDPWEGWASEPRI